MIREKKKMEIDMEVKKCEYAFQSPFMETSNTLLKKHKPYID